VTALATEGKKLNNPQKKHEKEDKKEEKTDPQNI
jgi:hypothetical protein